MRSKKPKNLIMNQIPPTYLIIYLDLELLQQLDIFATKANLICVFCGFPRFLISLTWWFFFLNLKRKKMNYTYFYYKSFKRGKHWTTPASIKTFLKEEKLNCTSFYITKGTWGHGIGKRAATWSNSASWPIVGITKGEYISYKVLEALSS
jgi:hypothetical protein